MRRKALPEPSATIDDEDWLPDNVEDGSGTVPGHYQSTLLTVDHRLRL